MIVQYLPVQVNTPDWRLDALCAETDPEAFFPEKGQSTREAKLVCSRCDVRPECLRDAIERDEQFGVRGGLSANERRRMQQAAKRDATPVAQPTRVAA